MAFKDALSRIMIERNIKAAELSRLSGVTEASISEYLRGKKEPLGKQSNAIANALNVSLDELWESEYAEKMHNLRKQKEKPAIIADDGLNEIASIFLELSPDNRAKLLELSRLYLASQHNSEER